jgi:hypothetical protein
MDRSVFYVCRSVWICRVLSDSAAAGNVPGTDRLSEPSSGPADVRFGLRLLEMGTEQVSKYRVVNGVGDKQCKVKSSDAF